MRKKNFKFAKGMYYFNVRSGQQNITIKRAVKAEAVQAYLSYVEIGKDCEWLGVFNGKKFDESSSPNKAVA